MKYRRIVATHRGKPEVLQMIEDDLPEPDTGEVRVRVLASGVAFGDVIYRMIFRGNMSATPGYDIVGIVDKLGAGVTTPAIGQVVSALPVRGGYTEYINITATELVPVPDDLDPAEAVSIVLNYVTAYQLLHRVAHVKKGQRILIHGAAGGVGTAMLQLGRLAEVEMYGTASKRKHKIISDSGGIPIDYKNEDVVTRLRSLGGPGQGGVDAILDATANMTNLWDSYHILRPHGQLICYGISSAIRNSKIHIASILAAAVLLGILSIIPGKSIKLYGITQMKSHHPQWYREDLMTLFNLLVQKKIQPVIAQRFPLSEAAQAHGLLERSAVTGKIVLMC
jgi:NADPH2:quinone reductase